MKPLPPFVKGSASTSEYSQKDGTALNISISRIYKGPDWLTSLPWDQKVLFMKFLLAIKHHREKSETSLKKLRSRKEAWINRTTFYLHEVLLHSSFVHRPHECVTRQATTWNHGAMLKIITPSIGSPLSNDPKTITWPNSRSSRYYTDWQKFVCRGSAPDCLKRNTFLFHWKIPKGQNKNSLPGSCHSRVVAPWIYHERST